MMKNHSNVTANLFSGHLTTYLVTFELTVVLGAIAIIASSALVLRHIYRKVRRSRADLLFIVLSISDIGVGSLSQLSLAILGYGVAASCIECNGTVEVELVYSFVFFLFFPYTFSYVVTTIVALDTLFVVTKQHSYKNFITKRRLMYILVFFFATTIALCLWLVSVMLARVRRARINEAGITYTAFNIALSIIIIGAYIFILCFAYSHSQNASHCKSNGNRDFKRLTKTMMFIFVSQVICIFPLQIYLASNIPLPPLMIPWLFILRNASSLFNGIILLLGERRKRKNKIRISKETGFLKDLAKFPSA